MNANLQLTTQERFPADATLDQPDADERTPASVTPAYDAQRDPWMTSSSPRPDAARAPASNDRTTTDPSLDSDDEFAAATAKNAAPDATQRDLNRDLPKRGGRTQYFNGSDGHVVKEELNAKNELLSRSEYENDRWIQTDTFDPASGRMIAQEAADAAGGRTRLRVNQNGAVAWVKQFDPLGRQVREYGFEPHEGGGMLATVNYRPDGSVDIDATDASGQTRLSIDPDGYRGEPHTMPLDATHSILLAQWRRNVMGDALIANTDSRAVPPSAPLLERATA